MELLIVDRTYTDWEGDRENYITLLKGELSKFDNSFKLEETDIGHGADLPMFLAIFSGAATLFFLGKKINENLDSWVSIGQKFHKLVTTLRERFGETKIDENGASFLAIQCISEQCTSITSLVKISESTIVISPFSQRNPKRLDSRADALYIQVFEVNNETMYVIGIKSQGTVEFMHKFGSNFMTFNLDDA